MALHVGVVLPLGLQLRLPRLLHARTDGAKAARSRTTEYVNPGLADRSGDSVFVKDDAGQIFHTYSTYGRGGEEFLGSTGSST